MFYFMYKRKYLILYILIWSSYKYKGYLYYLVQTIKLKFLKNVYLLPLPPCRNSGCATVLK